MVLSLLQPTDRKLRDMLNSGLNVTSFDIETTGVIGQDFRVTQVGHTTDQIVNGNVTNLVSTERATLGSFRQRTSVSELLQEELDWLESYNKTLPSGSPQMRPEHLLQMPTEDLLLEAHQAAGAADFGQRQKDSGALKQIVDAFRSNVQIDSAGNLAFKEGVSSVYQSVDALRDVLRASPGILLIQNTNFEDKIYQDLLKHTRGDQGISQEYARQFNEEIFGTQRAKALFSLPGSVVKGRQALRDSIYNLKDAYRLGMSDQVAKATGEVLQKRAELQQRIHTRVAEAISNNKSVVLDLMDFTDIFQTTLLDQTVSSRVAQQIPDFKFNPLLLQRGRSIELLAGVLLGEEETHTALSDASQQTRIFNKMLQMTDELETGVVSEDTVKYLKALSDPSTVEKDFAKTLHSRLTDVQIRAEGILDPIEKDAVVKRGIIDIIKDTKKIYSQLPEGSRLDRSQVFDTIDTYFQSSDDHPDPLRNIARVSGTRDAPHTPSRNLSSSSKLDNTLRSVLALQERLRGSEAIVERSASAVEASTPRILSGASQAASEAFHPAVKYGAIGLGVALVADMFLPDKVEPREHKKHIRQDTYDRLYENYYAGSAYADWRDRETSHRML